LSPPVPPAAPSWSRQFRLLAWPFRLVLVAVLGASLLTLGMSEFTVRSVVNDGFAVTRVLEREAAANRFMTLLLDIETGQRGYLLLGETPYLEPFQSAVRDIERTALELRQRVDPESPLRQRLDRVDVLTTQRLGFATAVINLAASGQRQAAIELVRQARGKRLMDEIRGEMAAVQRGSERELWELQARQKSATTWSRLALLVSTVLAIILLVNVARLAINEAATQETLRIKASEDAKLMQAVIASRTAELAALSSHLQVVTENEKADLARDLHDEMGALLTGARMDLSWLQGAAGTDPAVLEKLQQLSDGLSQAMDVKRRVWKTCARRYWTTSACRWHCRITLTKPARRLALTAAQRSRKSWPTCRRTSALRCSGSGRSRLRTYSAMRRRRTCIWRSGKTPGICAWRSGTTVPAWRSVRQAPTAPSA